MKSINFNVFIVFLAVLGLQIANLFAGINFLFYNKGSFLIFFLYLVFVLFYFMNPKHKLIISFDLKIILGILFFIPIISLLKYMFEYNLVKDGYIQIYAMKVIVFSIVKTIFLATIVFFIFKLNKEEIEKITKYYIISFLILILIALLLYFILGIHKPKFIMYYPMRFGAFHYELLYFVFSGLIAILYFIKRFNIFGLLLFLILSAILLKVTASNMIPIFLAIIFLILIFYKTRLFRNTYSFILLLYGFIFILVIYIMAEHIQILKALSFIFPRAGFEYSGDDWSKNSLLTRVSIHYTAFNYFVHHLSLFPPGIAGSLYMKEYVNPFVELKQLDGTGLTVFLSDYSIWSIVLISLLLIKIRHLGRWINTENINYFLIFNIAIFTITFHAGYLNYSVWTWLILCYRYIYLTRHKKIQCN